MKKNYKYFLLLFLFIALLVVIENCSDAGSKEEESDSQKLFIKEIITKYDSEGFESRVITIIYDKQWKILSHEFVDKNTSDNNCSTIYSYDSNGRKEKTIWNYYNEGIVKTDTYTYETIGNKLSITKIRINNSTNQRIETYITEYIDGKLSKEINIDNESEDGDNSIVDYFYDAEGRIIRKEHKHQDKSGIIDNDSYDIFDYDANGRNIKITSYDYSDPDKIETIITFEYDSKDRKIIENMDYKPVPEVNYVKYYYYNENSFIYRIEAKFTLEQDSNYIEIHNYEYY